MEKFVYHVISSAEWPRNKTKTLCPSCAADLVRNMKADEGYGIAAVLLEPPQCEWCAREGADV